MNIINTIPVGDDGPGEVYVIVQRCGGRGGDPIYGGAYIQGHTGHAASMLSETQLRNLAAALTKAADTLKEKGLPSFKEVKKKGWAY